MSLETNKTHKVFISYSWTTPDHENWVVELAQRLELVGFHVVFDKWDLKRGQDKYHFMETSVKDPEIDKVLIIIDEDYTDKADTRKGGVGTETQIISPQIYEKVNQDKFIPIVRQPGHKGQPLIPTFLRGRIYLDLSNENDFEEVFEELMRDIVNKPTHKRPKRGLLPKFLADDKDDVGLKTRHLVKGLDFVLNNKPERLNANVEDFLNEFYEALGNFKISITDTSTLAIGKLVVDSIEAYTPLRDDFVLYFNKIAKSGLKFEVDVLIDFLNKLPQYTIFTGSGSHYPVQFDQYKFIIHELFLSLIAIQVKNGNFKLIEELLYTKYQSPEKYNNRQKQSYRLFYDHITSIDTYYNTSKGGEFVSPQAKILVDRIPDSITKSALVEADLICHYMGELNIIPTENERWSIIWFPLLYIYQSESRLDFFNRITSARYFEKVKNVYGVKTSQELSEKIAQYKEKTSNDRRLAYSGSWESVTPLYNLIDYNEIGTER